MQLNQALCKRDYTQTASIEAVNLIPLYLHQEGRSWLLIKPEFSKQIQCGTVKLLTYWERVTDNKQKSILQYEKCCVSLYMTKYTDGKNTVTTKMLLALTSSGGKILSGIADVGRLSSKWIQIETKANWQYFRQNIPANCWVWIYVIHFDDTEKKLITFIFTKLAVLETAERG